MTAFGPCAFLQSSPMHWSSWNKKLHCRCAASLHMAKSWTLKREYKIRRPDLTDVKWQLDLLGKVKCYVGDGWCKGLFTSRIRQAIFSSTDDVIVKLAFFPGHLQVTVQPLSDRSKLLHCSSNAHSVTDFITSVTNIIPPFHNFDISSRLQPDLSEDKIANVSIRFGRLESLK